MDFRHSHVNHDESYNIARLLRDAQQRSCSILGVKCAGYQVKHIRKFRITIEYKLLYSAFIEFLYKAII